MRTGANWSRGSPNAQPVFDNGSSGYAVQLTQNVSLSSVEVETDNVTLDLNGYTYDGFFLIVGGGAGDIGSLTLQGPGTFEQGDFSSISVGNNSQLVISGATLECGTSTNALVGIGTNASIIVENGGLLQESAPVLWTTLIDGNLIVNNGTVTVRAKWILGP